MYKDNCDNLISPSYKGSCQETGAVGTNTEKYKQSLRTITKNSKDELSFNQITNQNQSKSDDNEQQETSCDQYRELMNRIYVKNVENSQKKNLKENVFEDNKYTDDIKIVAFHGNNEINNNIFQHKASTVLSQNNRFQNQKENIEGEKHNIDGSDWAKLYKKYEEEKKRKYNSFGYLKALGYSHGASIPNHQHKKMLSGREVKHTKNTSSINAVQQKDQNSVKSGSVNTRCFLSHKVATYESSLKSFENYVPITTKTTDKITRKPPLDDFTIRKKLSDSVRRKFLDPILASDKYSVLFLSFIIIKKHVLKEISQSIEFDESYQKLYEKSQNNTDNVLFLKPEQEEKLVSNFSTRKKPVHYDSYRLYKKNTTVGNLHSVRSFFLFI